MSNPTKKNVVIKDVYFAYTSVTKAMKQKTDKVPLSDHHLEQKSYEVKILVSEARFKRLRKAYKGSANISNAKVFDSKEELARKVKMSSEMADKIWNELGEDGEVYMVKFAQTALVGPATARRESRPIPVIGIRRKGSTYLDFDGNVIDREETILGNGTKGHISISPAHVGADRELYLYPAALCITNLVPYESAESVSDEDFGVIDEGDDTEGEFGVQSEDLGDNDDMDDYDDDIPF